MQRADEKPDPVPATGSRPEHGVMFYSREDELYDAVAAFLRPGLVAGEPVLIIATEEHQSAIERRLRHSSLDLDRALARGALRFLDAGATLKKFMVGTALDEDRFRALVGGLMGDPSDGPLRIYGEMVDILWQQGNQKAALHLEALWSELQEVHAFALLCAYRMGEFYKLATETHQLSSAHSHVVPLTPDRGNGSPAPSAQSLMAEIEQRSHMERALRDSLRDLRSAQAERDSANQRTERLIAITSAIADAVTHEQVYQAVVDQVAESLKASSAGLWVIDENQTNVTLVHSFGYHTGAARALSTPLASPIRFPALDVIASGRPIWIPSQEALVARYPNLQNLVTPDRTYQIAVLPVRTPSRMLGALGFTFDDAPHLEKDQQALLLLVARYCGQALERLRLLDAERQSRGQTELLYSLAGAVNRAQSMADVLSSALDAIGAAVETPRSAILSYDVDGVMRFKAWRGLSDAYRQAVEGHSPWSRDVRSPEPVLVANVERDPTMAPYLSLFRQEGIGALAFIPLVAEGALIGKFMVYYDRPRALTSREVEVAKAIAMHVATALARFAAAAELQQSIRFNEMFTGILGHDLRNPLSAILMAAHVLSKRSRDEALAKPLARVVSSGERMARMIDQLLDFTRVRLSGNIPLHTTSFDLASVVRQTMDELDDAHPDAKLELECEGDPTGVWDADRLLQVFSNLLGNAVQHGDREQGVHTRIDGLAPDQVRVEIRNRGVVPAHLLATIFDPMTRGERHQDKAQGLGLGLYITREIVRAHQGSIRVESRDGGTIFTVQLPRSSMSAGSRAT